MNIRERLAAIQIWERLAMHPIIIVIALGALLGAGIVWRVEHLYSCVKEDAADNSEVLVADNEAWRRVDKLLAQDAGPDTLKNLRSAVHTRVVLADALDPTNDTFC